jgi:non-ribosomal peptide synthetase component F
VTSVPLFEELVARAAEWPDRPALVGPDGSEVSYRELISDVCAVSDAIGEVQGTLAALHVQQPAARTVALLIASAKSAVAVPIDPLWPQARAEHLRNTLSFGMIISDVRAPLPEDAVPVDCCGVRLYVSVQREPQRSPRPANYVLFTSGSTGEPKGVEVHAEASLIHADGVIDWLGLGPLDRVLQFARLSFDTSQEEIWPTLLSGGCVVSLDSQTPTFDAFVRDLLARGVTVAQLPTSYWRALIRSGAAHLPELANAALRAVVIGGEAAYWEDARRWRDSMFGGVALINSYGPTEAGITASAFELAPGTPIPEDGPLPIGAPLGRRVFELRDVEGHDGGELVVSGPELAAGYLDTTTGALNTFPLKNGARCYATGDLVRHDRDGRLCFVGRIDRQVKVRGARINLSDIEEALLRAGAVEAFAFVENSPIRTSLLAAVTGAVDSRSLRASLRLELEDHAVPSRIMLLDGLPKLPNGKVDALTVSAFVRTNGQGRQK